MAESKYTQVLSEIVVAAIALFLIPVFTSIANLSGNNATMFALVSTLVVVGVLYSVVKKTIST